MVTVYVYYCASTCITAVTQYVYIIVLTHTLVLSGIGISYTVQILLLHNCDITISLRYELKEHFKLN